MTDYRSIEQRLTEILRLQRRPVTVIFRETPPAGTPQFTGTEPLGLQFLEARSGRPDLLHCPP